MLAWDTDIWYIWTASSYPTMHASTLILCHCTVRMNDQMKPITDVLRETENLNLAPEILEPEAQSIEKV